MQRECDLGQRRVRVKQRRGAVRRRSALALVAIAMAAAPFAALPAAATHWSGSGSLAPLRAFSNEVVSFTFTLNNSAPEPLQVFAVRMVACWHGGGGSSDIKPDDGTAVNISASGSHAFTGDILVPPLSPGLCHTAIVARGQAASDPTPGYGDYHFDVNYSTRPPLGLELHGAPADGAPPLNASFNATASGGEAPYSFAWDFADGGSGVGTALNHTFTTVGRFNVTVVASDAQGQRKSAFEEVWVHSGLAVEAAAVPASGDAPLTVDFSATTAGAFGAVAYNWTFGDGAVGSGATVSHIFAAASAYSVAITVEDAAHATANATINVTAWAPITVTVRVDPSGAAGRFAFAFNATASGTESSLSYHWQFGDGTDGFGQAVTHTYPAAGTYNVTVHVTDKGTGRVFEGHASVRAAAEAQRFPSTVVLAAGAAAGMAVLAVLVRRYGRRRPP